MKSKIQYYNSEEAAKILGVNVSTIKRWTDEGKLPCIKTAGGHRKFLMEHLADFLSTHKKKTEKLNLFPIESTADLRISQHIVKGDFHYLQDLILKNALSADTDKIQQILNGLYLSQYPLYQIYDHLLTPVLYEIGEMWAKGEIAIAEEHMATQAITDAIIRLQGIIHLPRKKIGKALCLNFTKEFHFLALKMVHHLLELRGFKVFFAGQNTPLQQIENIFDAYHPHRVYVSGTIIENKKEMQNEFKKFADLCLKYKAKLFVGGRAFDQIPINHPAVERRLISFQDVFNY